jgi:hypothetical protein
MSAIASQRLHEPVHRPGEFARVMAESRFRLPARLTLGVAAAALVAMPITLFNPGIFHESDPGTIGSMRGTALVLLALGLPLLLGGMRAALTGSRRGEMVWLGALGYSLYNAATFTIGVAFTRLFPAYLAMFALALWALITLATRLDPAAPPIRVSAGLRARAVAAYLGFTAFFTVALWGGQLLPALLDNAAPAGLDKTAMPTNLFHVMDLSVSVPLTLLAAVWLWRKQPWGYLLAGAMLVTGLAESIGVGVDQVFAHIEDPASSLVGAVIFAVMATVGAVAAAAFFRHVEAKS